MNSSDLMMCILDGETQTEESRRGKGGIEVGSEQSGTETSQLEKGR